MCGPNYRGEPGTRGYVGGIPEEENYVISYNECSNGHKYIPDQDSTIKDCPICMILKFRELIQYHFGGSRD